MPWVDVELTKTKDPWVDVPDEVSSVPEVPEKYKLNQPFDDPRVRATGGDALLMGYGNEISSGVRAGWDYLTKNKPFKENYDRNINEYEAQKESLAEDNPGLAARMTIGPALIGGGKLTGGIAPKGLGRQVATGMTIGAAEARGLSKPGDEEGAAETGALFGMGGSLLGAVAAPVIRNTPQAVKTVRRMFAEDAPLSRGAAKADAQDILGNVLNRGNKTIGEMSEEASVLGNQATVADVMGDKGATSLGITSRLSQEARDVVDGSILPGRAKNTPVRTRRDLGTSPDAADVSIMDRKHLGAIENNIGKDMDTFYSEYGRVPLDNQAKLNGLLGEKSKVLDTARKKYNLKYGKDIQFDDLNTPIIDHDLDKLIRVELDQKISTSKNPLGKATPVTQEKIDTLSKWKQLADDSSAPEIRELRDQYAVAAKNTRAYNDGTKFSGMSESEVKRWVELKSPEELRAFRSGAVEDLANKGEGITGSLGKDTNRNTLRTVFGDDVADDMLTTVEREKQFAKTSDAHTAGAKTGLDEDIKGDITGNSTRDFQLGGTLRGKRAYSQQGAVFMFVNEIVDNFRNIKVPRETQVELARILTTSEDIPTALAQIEKMHMSKENIRRVLTIGRKLVNAEVTGAAGAGSGVMKNLTEKNKEGTKKQKAGILENITQ